MCGTSIKMIYIISSLYTSWVPQSFSFTCHFQGVSV